MEVQTARASRFKYAMIGVSVLLFAGFIFFAFSRSTSAALKVLGFGTNQCGDFVVLQLTNLGPRTIIYRGFETNDPWVVFQFHTIAGPSNMYRYRFNPSVQDVELKPRQSVNFQVLTSDIQQDYQVTLTYRVPTAPGPLDWLRFHLPYQISHWLYRSSSRTALTPLIRTNSQLAETN